MRIPLAVLGLSIIVGAFLLCTPFINHTDPSIAPDNNSEALKKEADVEFTSQRAPRVAIAPKSKESPSDAKEPVRVNEIPPQIIGDLNSKVPITIRVLDETNTPVAMATVRVYAMLSDDNPNEHFQYRGVPVGGTTDHDGRLKLDIWEWVNIDGRAREVTLQVTHEAFVIFTGNILIGSTESVIYLERGPTVVVTGWYGAHSKIIRNLELHIDDETDLGLNAWSPLLDGRLATNRIPKGVHWIVASYTHPKLGRMSSLAERFEVQEFGWETLHLELHPTTTFIGQLDASVPRPIINGKIMLIMHSESLDASDPVISKGFPSDIAPDGSFTIPNLRPGVGQFFALCQGWSSSKGALDTTLHRTVQGESLPSEAGNSQTHLLQHTRVPQIDNPYIVLMERTGSLKVTVSGSIGDPLESATVYAMPNINVTGVGSWAHPWRHWVATTDATGIARIHNVPPTPSLRFGVSAKGLQMNARARENTPVVAIQSGKEASTAIRLVNKDV
ncbi:MAG: hypothetical protein JKY61_05850 [Planctomycetes bacterium]|nr:hypothetical protein [Planctomycetota bacterium]